MNTEDSRPAVVGQVEPSVRPDAWWARAENGNIRAWTSAPAESLRLAEEVGFQLEPLYSRAALDATADAERERLALWLESQHGDRAQREHAAKLAALMRRS